MRVHFIRHGKRDRNIGDPSLTSEGRSEAKKLAMTLVSNNISHIFSSPLARTKETAEIIATTLNLKVIEDARLRERMNWGDLKDQSFDEFISQWERCSQERDYQPSVGDSSINAGKRIEAFVSNNYTKAPKSTVIGITHGGVLADFLRNVFSSEELNHIHPQFCTNPYSAEIIRECSVTTISYDDNEYQLNAIGDISFLE